MYYLRWGSLLNGVTKHSNWWVAWRYAMNSLWCVASDRIGTERKFIAIWNIYIGRILQWLGRPVSIIAFGHGQSFCFLCKMCCEISNYATSANQYMTAFVVIFFSLQTWMNVPRLGLCVERETASTLEGATAVSKHRVLNSIDKLEEGKKNKNKVVLFYSKPLYWSLTRLKTNFLSITCCAIKSKEIM